MSCPYQVVYKDDSLQITAYRIETFKSPAPRCVLKMPDHWPDGAKKLGGLRWIASGGDALVFGPCSSKSCPNDPQSDLYISGEPQ